jgi:hypothetical protein
MRVERRRCVEHAQIERRSGEDRRRGQAREQLPIDRALAVALAPIVQGFAFQHLLTSLIEKRQRARLTDGENLTYRALVGLERLHAQVSGGAATTT